MLSQLTGEPSAGRRRGDVDEQAGSRLGGEVRPIDVEALDVVPPAEKGRGRHARERLRIGAAWRERGPLVRDEPARHLDGRRVG